MVLWLLVASGEINGPQYPNLPAWMFPVAHFLETLKKISATGPHKMQKKILLDEASIRFVAEADLGWPPPTPEVKRFTFWGFFSGF